MSSKSRHSSSKRSSQMLSTSTVNNSISPNIAGYNPGYSSSPVNSNNAGYNPGYSSSPVNSNSASYNSNGYSYASNNTQYLVPYNSQYVQGSSMPMLSTIPTMNMMSSMQQVNQSQLAKNSLQISDVKQIDEDSNKIDTINDLSNKLSNNFNRQSSNEIKRDYSKLSLIMLGICLGHFLDLTTMIVMVIFWLLWENNPLPIGGLTPQELTTSFTKAIFKNVLSFILRSQDRK